MATLVVCLVKGMPTTIAISFLQASTLAAIDQPTSCQDSKITGYHELLVIVHTVRSWAIVIMRFDGITTIDLSGVIRYIEMLSR